MTPLVQDSAHLLVSTRIELSVGTIFMPMVRDDRATLTDESSSYLKIGIIGAGYIGSTLTRRLTKLGHEVFVANSRGPETLAGLAEETGAQAVTVEEAARVGEVVAIAIPEGRVRDLPKDLFAGAPDDQVVIDTGNYYPNGNDHYGRSADGFKIGRASCRERV